MNVPTIPSDSDRLECIYQMTMVEPFIGPIVSKEKWLEWIGHKIAKTPVASFVIPRQCAESSVQSDGLMQAMRAIIASIPACDASGGFFFEHHDQDGEFLGVEQVNPADIIRAIDELAHNAIAAVERGSAPLIATATPVAPRKPIQRCAAGRDGDCMHPDCPQLRDNEPVQTGRHCPLDISDEDD